MLSDAESMMKVVEEGLTSHKHIIGHSSSSRVEFNVPQTHYRS